MICGVGSGVSVFLLWLRFGTKMMAPVWGPGFGWLELLYQHQAREHLSFLMYLSRLGVKGKGEGQGLKAVSNQHQKWSQTLSRMKFQRAGERELARQMEGA